MLTVEEPKEYKVVVMQ